MKSKYGRLDGCVILILLPHNNLQATLGALYKLVWGCSPEESNLVCWILQGLDCRWCNQNDVVSAVGDDRFTALFQI